MSLEKALADNTAAVEKNTALLEQLLAQTTTDAVADPQPEPAKKAAKKTAKKAAKKAAKIELPDDDEDDDDEVEETEVADIKPSDISDHVRNVFADKDKDLTESRAKFKELREKWGVAKVSDLTEEQLPGALADVQKL
jgi:hypothetical protein